jgi:hypothetical protein
MLPSKRRRTGLYEALQESLRGLSPEHAGAK